MKKKEWQVLLDTVQCKASVKPAAGAIVDSPWIPQYAEVSHLDYYTDMNVWFTAQQKMKDELPNFIFLPDYWVEFGMAAEPSGFGCKVNFYMNQPTAISHIVNSADDIEMLSGVHVPNPYHDGLMPLVINYYKNVNPRVKEIGEEIKIVASRGPLNIAAQMMGVSEFLCAVKLYPDQAHMLLRKTTALVKDWLSAQADVLDSVEGIMVLDDIAGFFSEQDYLEFAHTYLSDIFSSFSVPVRIFHNDTDNPVSYPYIEKLGVNMFNMTHLQPISRIRELVGDNVALLGNIPPLQVLGVGTVTQVEEYTRACLSLTQHCGGGLMISAGGGISPGTPIENLVAMQKATQ